MWKYIDIFGSLIIQTQTHKGQTKHLSFKKQTRPWMNGRPKETESSNIFQSNLYNFSSLFYRKNLNKSINSHGLSIHPYKIRGCTPLYLHDSTRMVINNHYYEVQLETWRGQYIDISSSFQCPSKNNVLFIYMCTGFRYWWVRYQYRKLCWTCLWISN